MAVKRVMMTMTTMPVTACSMSTFLPKLISEQLKTEITTQIERTRGFNVTKRLENIT